MVQLRKVKTLSKNRLKTLKISLKMLELDFLLQAFSCCVNFHFIPRDNS